MGCKYIEIKKDSIPLQDFFSAENQGLQINLRLLLCSKRRVLTKYFNWNLDTTGLPTKDETLMTTLNVLNSPI